MQSQERTCGIAARAIVCAALSSATLAYAGSAQAEVPVAPTREVASKCRSLAYRAYPNQRPGHTAGSGARYALFKDCIDKGGFVDEGKVSPASQPTSPAPQLGPPPASQPPAAPPK
jgi:hypothetical protein